MRNILIFKALFGALFLLSACEQVITIDLPSHEPSLVLYATGKQGDSLLEVYLSHTVSILDNRILDSSMYFWNDTSSRGPYAQALWLPDAQVSLFIDGQWQGDLQADSSRHSYKMLLNGGLRLDNQIYEIKVQHTDYEAVNAKSVWLTTPNVSEFAYSQGTGHLASEPDGASYDELSFYLQDVPNQEDYYELEVYLQPQTSNPNVYPYYTYLNSNDPRFESSSTALIFSDAGFDGQRYKVEVLGDFLMDTLNFRPQLRLRHISRDAYLYAKSLSQYLDAHGNPFAEPVVLYSNIKNGRGLFNLYNERREWITN